MITALACEDDTKPAPVLPSLEQSALNQQTDVTAKAKLFGETPIANNSQNNSDAKNASPATPAKSPWGDQKSPQIINNISDTKLDKFADSNAAAINKPQVTKGPVDYFSQIPNVVGPPKSKILELRLLSLSKRVKRMHEAWLAKSDEWSQRAMELESRRLAARLDPIIKRVERRSAVSLHVRHLRSQRVLYDHNGLEQRNPASNQKMLTISAALDLLGPESHFETKVMRTADTLFIIGGGDPTLTPERINEYAQTLTNENDLSGIVHLVIDETAFSNERFTPGMTLDDVGYAYAAPSGALSFADNVVHISVTPSSTGGLARVQVSPYNHHILIDSQVRIIASHEGENTVWVRTRPRGDQTAVEVRGEMRANDKPLYEKRRVYDPGMFTGQAFGDAIAKASGQAILPVVRGRAPSGGHLLQTWNSLPLIDIAKDTLAFSNNFATEMILRTIAWRFVGIGSFEEGKNILEQYWQTIGVTPNALVVDNGSGLTREGRFTAQGLVDLLSAAHLVQPANSGLLAVLPVAGKPGTLAHRQSHARGRLRAKTGTLNGVSALTGIITKVTGDPVIAFSLVINPTANKSSLDVGARHAAEEDIGKVLVGFVDDLVAKEPQREKRRR
ncbi:MAG: D-alanyl-D-alanine carboxypeptidase/D-alanyl-D-alanine-endopeptidase [Deltaproteobacteria bacterium]|nr:D-alanyl-D-alanine carboxypeptidase/D-alanyl-D-alanine-endopeptidase [Deltaproteobacteria bacterium]